MTDIPDYLSTALWHLEHVSAPSADEENHLDRAAWAITRALRQMRSPSWAWAGGAPPAVATLPAMSPAVPAPTAVAVLEPPAPPEVIADAVTVRTTAQRAHRNREEALARLVFTYWQEVMGSHRSVFDKNRQARIIARLRENRGDAGELLYAIDGAEKDDFIMGRAARTEGRKYNGVETILRDRAIVERFAGSQRGYQREEEHPMLRALNTDPSGD